jgi:hypothetical protein
LPVITALDSFVHGIALLHVVLSVPTGSTYATFVPSLHEPSGRHTFDAHCACIVHGWHMSSLPHTGIKPMHAAGSLAVHCTHLPLAMSQTLGEHCADVVHALAPSPLFVQLGSAGWPAQNPGLLSLQAPSAAIAIAA